MRAISAGRLKESVSKNDAGYWRIEPVAADKEWKTWTDPSKVPKTKAGGRPARTGNLFDEEQREEAMSHARSSAIRIQVDTELKQLELDSRRGNLIDRGAVTRAAFQIARDLRERLMAIPDRLASEIHAAKEIQDVHRLLTEELAHALDSFAKSKEFREVTRTKEAREDEDA